MVKFPEMPEFVVADVGPGGEVEVDGGHDEGGGGVAGGALQQPIRGCDCGHVTSCQPISTPPLKGRTFQLPCAEDLSSAGSNRARISLNTGNWIIF